MIIDMSDTVIGKYLKLAKPEQARVANLNRIPKITGQEEEKLIEP
jgi:hypothetical protein